MKTASSMEQQSRRKKNDSFSSRPLSVSLVLQGFTLMFLLCIVCCNGQQQLRRQQQASSNSDNAPKVIDLTLDFEAAIPLDDTPGGRRIRDTLSEIPDVRTAMVLEHGKIVAQYVRPGVDPNGLYQIWSSTKSVVSMLIGIMVDEGSLSSLDETLGDIWPESEYSTMWSNVTNADFRKSITIRRLLTMTSGLYLPLDEDFGAFWDGGDAGGVDLSSVLSHGYANETTNQFSYVATGSYLSYVIQARTGMTPGQYAADKLFPYLGMNLKSSNDENNNDHDGVGWWKNPEGVEFGFHGLMMNTYQMAKVGQLFLQKGVSGETTVVSPEWIEESTSNAVMAQADLMGIQGAQYGYLTWVMDGYYCARGMFEQNICVSESLDRVIVQQTDLYSDSGVGEPLMRIAFDPRTSFVEGAESEIVENSPVEPTSEEGNKMEADPCAPCAPAAPCFAEDGCSFRDETTMMWSAMYESCNALGPFCGACFPSSVCLFVVETVPADIEIDWLTPFADESARSVAVNVVEKGTGSDGTTISFSWLAFLLQGGSDIYEFSSKDAFDDCDFSGSPLLVGSTNPVSYEIFPRINETTAFYFAGPYNKCKAGQKVELFVTKTIDDSLPEENTIVDIAAANADFSTLVSLVQMAGLVDTLNGPGPFTVFAPTNEAFAALPEDTVAWLTAEENKDALVKVLTYHVVSGNVMSSDLAVGDVATVEGQSVAISLSPVMINTANVIAVDIKASNGVIHVVDSILIPDGVLPEENTIVEIAVANADFSTLVSLVQMAGLVDTLNGPGPFTVFVPTNEAFAALPEDTVAWLTAEENKDALIKVLTYHVVSGSVMSSDLVAGDVTTVEGQSVAVSLSPVMINAANVIAADIKASNGVIHVVNSILIPDGVLPEVELKTKEIGWLKGFRDPSARVTSVDTGTVLNFSWQGYHDVLVLPTKAAFDACDFTNAVSLGDVSPVSYTVTDTTYFACSVPGHCSGGQKLEASVSTTVAAVMDAEPELSSVAGVAMGDENFSTLVSLVQMAGLVDTLSGPGPFTVFAPTNEAFAALPESTVAWLTAAKNKDALVKVLTYHVVSGKVMSSDLVAGDVATVEGQSVAVSLAPVTINTAKVITVDIKASNGVIHVVESVLIPNGVLPDESTADDVIVVETPVEAVAPAPENIDSAGCLSNTTGSFLLISSALFWSFYSFLF